MGGKLKNVPQAPDGQEDRRNEKARAILEEIAIIADTTKREG